MTVKYFALLTNLGAAKLANAAALGTPLQITHMAVGDGGGALPIPNPAQTQLVGEKRRAALNSLSIDEANSSQIIAEQVIPETDGGWWIREIGLFDKDGVLIAIANCPDTYKPQLQEGSGRTQTVRMVLIVSSTEAVTLKIDPSVVLATRKYVDDKVIEVKTYADELMIAHLTAVDPHSQYAPKASPALTGKPTTPTPAAGNNTQQLANTAFVQAALTALGLGDAAKLSSGVAGGVALFNDTLRVVNDLIEIKNKGEIAKTNARVNLGCGTAAAKDVGTGAGQIPDMSAWSFVKNADNSKWTLTLPNGFLLQKSSVVTSGATATINAAWLTPFPIECLGVWGTDGSSGVADLGSANAAQLPAGRIYYMLMTTTYATVGGYGGIDIYAIGH
ncbi:phage tail protein [Yersinia bercovieri]|uniref:phage tail protein n=1 Tax=Yersinia bercovieri TaxID=634 RepID=UPI0005DEE247|nr:phage tail protein [Yersinia bercovieri]MDN0103122.1 phage tail protein [Yersinia bercovieri]CNH76218.1 tail fiber protein [Yersinia bercovieri]